MTRARLVLLVAIVAPAAVAHAELTSQNVLILANGADPSSLPLAKHYAQRRGIPPTRILALRCPTNDTITRSQYDNLIARPVRMFLRRQKLTDQIKVIVTVYGMPLRVRPAKPDKPRRQLAAAMVKRYQREFIELEAAHNQLADLAGIATTQPTTLPARDHPNRFPRNRHRILRRISRVMARMEQTLKTQPTRDAQKRLFTQAMQIRVKLLGVADLTARNQADPTVADKLRRMMHQFAQALAEDPGRRDLKACLAMARQIGGQVLVLKTIYEDVARLKYTHSSAAIDDELTLLLHETYMLAGRIPNALNPRLARHPLAGRWTPVIMTARLDGPTPAIVKRMIDEALHAEAKGLAGKVYIDAQGLKPGTPKFAYDEDLRRLAEQLKARSRLTTILDNRRALFPPGSAPDAAIYCGWYSLKKYVPAFKFVPGAVAFHIASFEAQSLHNRALNLWCPKLLEAGAAATVGPVDEPYLDAFPLPSEFFSLLMSGRYTLVEAFFLTKRYNSWRVILIGDPLYRPFAVTAQLPAADLAATPLPVSPIP